MPLTGPQFLTLEWCLLSLAIIFVAIRCGVRVWRGVWTTFWLSDLMLVFALMFPVCIAIADAHSYAMGKMDVEDSVWNTSREQWDYASSIIYDTGFYFPRFSLLAFYNDLIPASELGLRISLYLVAAYTIGCFLSTAFLDMFWCGANISVNWDEQSDCSLQTSATPMFVNWATGFTTELLIFFLPLPLLWRLKSLERKERIALACAFLLGIVTITVSIARRVVLNWSIYAYETYILGVAETATQVIVISLPTLRPLLGKVHDHYLDQPKLPPHEGGHGDSQSRNYPNNAHFEAAAEMSTEKLQRIGVSLEEGARRGAGSETSSTSSRYLNSGDEAERTGTWW